MSWKRDDAKVLILFPTLYAEYGLLLEMRLNVLESLLPMLSTIISDNTCLNDTLAVDNAGTAT
jgi:hypothetical protein